MNVTETKTVVYNLAEAEDRFALISSYLKDGAVVKTNYIMGVDDAGDNVPIACELKVNGEVKGGVEAVGYKCGTLPELFKAEYEKAQTEGLASIKPKAAPAARKASGVSTGTVSRGRLTKAQEAEIAEMSLSGMTAEDISAKTGRSVESVKKYMKVENHVPVGAMAEADSADAGDEGADGVFSESEEEETVIL